MKAPNDKILQRVTELASQNPDICILWLYGSRANDTATATEHSDYDLAVAFSDFNQSPFDTLIRPHTLAMDWQSILGANQDTLSIVDINNCPIPLAMNIIEADCPLVVKDDLRYTRELSRIWAHWSDIEYYNQPIDRPMP